MNTMILLDGPCRGERQRQDSAELTAPQEFPSYTFWREQFDTLVCDEGDLAWVEPAVHYYHRLERNNYAHANICPCRTDEARGWRSQ